MAVTMCSSIWRTTGRPSQGRLPQRSLAGALPDYCRSLISDRQAIKRPMSSPPHRSPAPAPDMPTQSGPHQRHQQLWPGPHRQPHHRRGRGRRRPRRRQAQRRHESHGCRIGLRRYAPPTSSLSGSLSIGRRPPQLARTDTPRRRHLIPAQDGSGAMRTTISMARSQAAQKAWPPGASITADLAGLVNYINDYSTTANNTPETDALRRTCRQRRSTD